MQEETGGEVLEEAGGEVLEQTGREVQEHTGGEVLEQTSGKVQEKDKNNRRPLFIFSDEEEQSNNEIRDKRAPRQGKQASNH